MRLLYGRDREVAHWVCERIPHLAIRIPYYELGMVLGPATAIGVTDDAGVMAGGVIFHNHDPFVRSMEVSCAAANPAWATRGVLRILLRYAFLTADCTRLSAATPKTSTSPRRFLEGIGFKREASIRRGFGTENALVYGMLREEWEHGPFGPRRQRNEDLTDGEEVRAEPAASA